MYGHERRNSLMMETRLSRSSATERSLSAGIGPSPMIGSARASARRSAYSSSGVFAFPGMGFKCPGRRLSSGTSPGASQLCARAVSRSTWPDSRPGRRARASPRQLRRPKRRERRCWWRRRPQRTPHRTGFRLIVTRPGDGENGCDEDQRGDEQPRAEGRCAALEPGVAHRGAPHPDQPPTIAQGAARPVEVRAGCRRSC